MILALDTTSNRAKFKLKTYSLLPYKVNVFYNCRKIRFLVRRLPFVLVERKKFDKTIELMMENVIIKLPIRYQMQQIGQKNV